MKLLLDQNISFRVIQLIKHQFVHSKQVRKLGLENASDKEIWNYAKNHQFTVVTFDADFYEFSNYYGHPPKIIWLRTGNIRSNEIASLLLSKSEIIRQFVENMADVACIELE